MAALNWNSAGLKPSVTPGARVDQIGKLHWRLSIPAGPAGQYRLAELDDYTRLNRRSFPWAAPFQLHFQARASAKDIPGTWGLGLWNDPFGLGVGSRAPGVRLPTLPNAAWFFFASQPNYLTLRDDLPAWGAMASIYRAAPLSTALAALAAPAWLLLAFPAAARRLRRFASHFVHQQAVALPLEPTGWHTFSLDWRAQAVRFQVDGQVVLHTSQTPWGRLGLVIWIDNQYAAFPPDGKMRYGTLAAQEENWIEMIAL